MERDVSSLVNRAVSLVALVYLCHCDNIVGSNFLCWNVSAARGVGREYDSRSYKVSEHDKESKHHMILFMISRNKPNKNNVR